MCCESNRGRWVDVEHNERRLPDGMGEVQFNSAGFRDRKSLVNFGCLSGWDALELRGRKWSPYGPDGLLIHFADRVDERSFHRGRALARHLEADPPDEKIAHRRDQQSE